MEEITISGAIKWIACFNRPEGYYIIKTKTGQRWVTPINEITPDDLRAMADHLERMRSNESVGIAKSRDGNAGRTGEPADENNRLRRGAG